MTRFAVVVTSYNYRAYVCEAVERALGQTRPPAQVIVVDDGSTDGSAQLLAERFGQDPRVTLVPVANGGQLSAFQRGMAFVGDDIDVVCFLDSDDHWEPTYFATIGAVYDARKDVGFIVSDMRWFGEQNKLVGFGPAPIDFGYTVISTYAATAWYGAPTSALSMRASFARRCMLLPDEIIRTWRLSADNALVYGASLFGARKLYLPTGLVNYRIHGSNGWWSNLGSEQSYLNRVRSRQLIGWYAKEAGLDNSVVELARLEFKTKPDPSWKETRRYAAICMRSDAPWWKRYEHALSVLGRRLKGSKKATVVPAAAPDAAAGEPTASTGGSR